jgi:type I restriction enzyme S subunit
MSTTLARENENTPGLSGWDEIILGDIVSFRREPIDPETNLGMRYVGLEHINSGQMELMLWGNAADVRSLKNRFYARDILYGKLRPYLDKAVLVDFDGLCSTDIIVVSCSKRVLPEFLVQILHTREFLAFADSTTTGVNHPRTSWNALKDFSIRLPPLPEQQAIARALSTIHRAQSATRQVIDATRQTKKSLMVTLFRERDAGSTEQAEAEISRLPQGWDVDKLGNLFDIQQGKALSPAARSGVSPRPFLRTANVFWGRVDLTTVDQMDFTDEEAKFYALKPGDLLICEGGDIGRTAIWDGALEPCYYQNHLHRLRPIKDGIIPLFYMYWMDAAFNLFGLYVGVGNRTTIPNLSKGRLSAFLVPVPTRAAQERVASQLRALDNKLRVEETRLKELDALYQTLLSELLSGRIRLPIREVEANA